MNNYEGYNHMGMVESEILDRAKRTMKTSDQETLDQSGPQFSRDDSSSPGIPAFRQMVLLHYEKYRPGHDLAKYYGSL